jgi:hypothetical protein
MLIQALLGRLVARLVQLARYYQSAQLVRYYQLTQLVRYYQSAQPVRAAQSDPLARLQ